MNDELDSAAGTHIDRRSLLKKAGAAGALGLAVPISFDSFLSPAAACSVEAFAQLGTFESATAGTQFSISGVTVPVGQLALIAIVGAKANSGGELGITSVTGGAISDSQLVQTAEYIAPPVGRTFLWVYRATGTGTAGSVTVNFSNTSLSVQMSVMTIEVAADPNPVVQAVPAVGDDNTAEVSFPSVGANNTEYFAVSGNSNTAHGWDMPNPWQELSDDYILGPSAISSVSLATFQRVSATSGAAVATATVNATVLDRWGAIRVEVSCA